MRIFYGVLPGEVDGLKRFLNKKIKNNVMNIRAVFAYSILAMSLASCNQTHKKE